MEVARNNTHQIYSNYIVIAALSLFPPLGIFLMWRHTKWKKQIKTLISTYFCILLIIPIVLWTAIIILNVLRSNVSTDNLTQSLNYTCQVYTTQSNVCRSIEHNFSIEYPAQWYYYEKYDWLLLSSEKLSPNNNDNWIIRVNPPYVWDSEEAARDFLRIGWGTYKKEETLINGLQAVKLYDIDYIHDKQSGYFSGIIKIRENNRTYVIETQPYGLDYSKFGLSNKDIEDIIDRVAGSFKIHSAVDELE